MAELYGMAEGVRVAQQDAQRGIANALGAQKALLDIEKEQLAVKDLKATSEAWEGYQKELAAKGNPHPGGERPVSTTNMVQDFLAFAGGKLPYSAAASLTKTAAELAQKEAAAAASTALVQQRKIETAKKLNERIGSMALAAKQDPTLYPRILLQAAQEGLPVNRLPASYDPRVIDSLITESMDVDKQLDLKRKALADQVKARTGAARVANLEADTAIKQVKKKEAEIDLRDIQKNGGRYSDEAVAARRTKRDYQEALKDAKNLSMYPSVAGLSKDKVTLGKLYTVPGQGIAKAVKQADGSIGFELQEKAAPARRGAAAAADEDFDDEDLE